MEDIMKQLFKEYEAFVELTEKTLKKVKEGYSEQIKCTKGCSDCCYAFFDLTLIEAIYINYHFNKKFTGKAREKMLEKANSIDRKIHKIKKEAYKSSKEGNKDIEVLGKISEKKARCPLLNEQNLCDLYEYRPLTCRIYGVPTSNLGASHTCGLSGFKQGEKYPTINMDIIYAQLYNMTKKFTDSINSKYTKLFEMLVPLSMALLTNYNDDYLGVIKKDKK